MGVDGRAAVKNRAVFLDRDGVLNRAVVRNGKPCPPPSVAELEMEPHAKTTLRELKELGFTLLVVTNQPDVAKGNTTRQAVEAINHRLAAVLPVDDFFVCYHQDSDECTCRKPKPGLLLQGARKYGVDLAESFMVGDRWRDVEAGQAAGCRTVLIERGYQEQGSAIPADATVHSLREAADWILQESRRGAVR